MIACYLGTRPRSDVRGLVPAIYLPVSDATPDRPRHAPLRESTSNEAAACDAVRARYAKRCEARASHAGGGPTPSRGGQTGPDSTQRGSGGVGIGFPPRDLEILASRVSSIDEARFSQSHPDSGDETVLTLTPSFALALFNRRVLAE